MEIYKWKQLHKPATEITKIICNYLDHSDISIRADLSLAKSYLCKRHTLIRSAIYESASVGLASNIPEAFWGPHTIEKAGANRPIMEMLPFLQEEKVVVSYLTRGENNTTR